MKRQIVQLGKSDPTSLRVGLPFYGPATAPELRDQIRRDGFRVPTAREVVYFLDALSVSDSSLESVPRGKYMPLVGFTGMRFGKDWDPISVEEIPETDAGLQQPRKYVHVPHALESRYGGIFGPVMKKVFGDDGTKKLAGLIDASEQKTGSLLLPTPKQDQTGLVAISPDWAGIGKYMVWLGCDPSSEELYSFGVA